MTLGPPGEWGDTMAAPRVWGWELTRWLEASPPTTRDDVDLAHRALLDLRADLDQVLDVLEVEMRRHNAELPRYGPMLRGDDAREHADALEARRETLELEDAIDEANEADYRASLEAREPLIEREEPRADRDLPGYDERLFGRDELDRPPPLQSRRRSI